MLLNLSNNISLCVCLVLSINCFGYIYSGGFFGTICNKLLSVYKSYGAIEIKLSTLNSLNTSNTSLICVVVKLSLEIREQLIPCFFIFLFKNQES
ncbi:hypothetical protein D3C73_1274980 [compost metagenome]